MLLTPSQQFSLGLRHFRFGGPHSRKTAMESCASGHLVFGIGCYATIDN